VVLATSQIGVKDKRILGYRLGADLGMEGHVDYWLDTGIRVRRRTTSVSRGYGSEGGISPWECLRLLQAVYMPTVCYSLEFIARFPKVIQKIQGEVNDTLRARFQAPFKFANTILYCETGIAPINEEARLAKMKAYYTQVKWGYNKDLPWNGSEVDGYNDIDIQFPTTFSDKELIAKPMVIGKKSKEESMSAYL